MLFSSLFTLLLTTIDLYSEYRTGYKQLTSTQKAIATNHKQAIESSIWLFETPKLEAYLESIIDLPNVSWATLSYNEKTIISGNTHAKYSLTRAIPLEVNFNGETHSLGLLTIGSSLENVYKRMRSVAIFTLFGHFLKSTIVVLFSFFCFGYLVSKHLDTIAAYVNQKNFEDNVEPLKIQRSTWGYSQNDELDSVVHSINSLRTHLEEKQHQLALAHTEILQNEKLAAIGKTAGVVAHEIRSPLTVIMHSLELLKHASGENDTKKINDLTEVAHDAAERINGIVSGVYSSLQSSPRKKELTDISTWLIANQKWIQLRSLYHITLRLQINCLVVISQEELLQCLCNLVENASQEQARLSLDQHPDNNIELKVHCDQTELNIQVIDKGNGPSLPLEVLLQPMISTKSTALGLGLVLVQRVIENHQGRFSMSHSAGTTTVTIVLPQHTKKTPLPVIT